MKMYDMSLNFNINIIKSFLLVKKKKKNHAYLPNSLMLCLFQWKILCKDNFPYFLVFGSIKKKESK